MRFPAFATIRSSARVWFAALLAGVGFAAVAAPAAQAALGVETLVAGNCTAAYKTCGSENVEPVPGFSYSVPKEPTPTEAKEQGYTQAAGHPKWGITDFKIATVGKLPNEAPSGVVTHVRTDVGPGVSVNPQAVAQCSMKEFDANEKEEEAIPGTGFYPEPQCKKNKEGEVESEIGVNLVTAYAGPGGVLKVPVEISDLPLEGIAYNVVPPEGKASDFGVALQTPDPADQSAARKRLQRSGRKRGKTRSRRLPLDPATESRRGRPVLRPHPHRRRRGMGR